ncbi:MAG TPA: hypothetical protein VNH44_05340 [Micropepsaceae bacterium]|nr:hypothetical protein [Micropepsaceae bacterium]
MAASRLGLGILIASATFLLADVEPGFAQGMAQAQLSQHGVAVPDGLAAMVQLRIPLGEGTVPSRGKRGRKPQRTLSLTLGTSWHDQTGSPDFTGPRYLSTVEAGVTFEGEPVAKIGSIDLVKPDDDTE